MSKTINFAGVSRVAGVLKFRTATDEKRIEQLIKLGDTDVELVEVYAVDKAEAARVLLAIKFQADNDEVQALLWNMSQQKETVAKPKAKGEVRVKKVVKAPTAPVPAMTREERAIQKRFWENNFIAPAMSRQTAAEADQA
jgi:hypothetical protein